MFALQKVDDLRLTRYDSLEIKKSDTISRFSRIGSSSVGYISKGSALLKTPCGGMTVRV